MMMEGIDESFDAAIFIGYHTSTTNTASGVRAHTISSANLTAVRLNGVEMLEASINAAIAGDFGVPVVVMISGDDAVVEEARRVIGDMEGAVVKALPRLPLRADDHARSRPDALIADAGA